MALDRLDPEVIKVIDSKSVERDAGEKPVPTFSHPAPTARLARAIGWQLN
jgi:hypothetical protein